MLVGLWHVNIPFLNLPFISWSLEYPSIKYSLLLVTAAIWHKRSPLVTLSIQYNFLSTNYSNHNNLAAERSLDPSQYRHRLVIHISLSCCVSIDERSCTLSTIPSCVLTDRRSCPASTAITAIQQLNDLSILP